MDKTNAIIIPIAVLVFLGGCGQQKKQAIEDVVAAYPDEAQVIFENDYVRAVEFTLEPGEKLPLHKGGPRAVYALSNYQIKWDEGGLVSEKEWQKGDIHWHDAISHAIENIGDSEAKYLVVTRKEKELPDTGVFDISRDASQLDSEHSKIIFENDHVRVIEVALEAGESQPKHDGIHRLIYSLTDYQILYTYGENNTVEVELKAGDIHWHTADNHSVKNIGDSLVHYLIYEFKK